MMKKMRRFLSTVLTLAMMFSICVFPAQAAHVDVEGLSHNAVSNSVSSDVAIKCTWEDVTAAEMQEVLDSMPDHSEGDGVTINEIDLLLSRMEQTPAALSEVGFGTEEIDDILSGETEAKVRAELLRRKELPDQTLRGYGYTDDEIQMLRELTGTESLEEYRTLAAEFTCYNTLKFHRYYTDIDITHFVYTFEWEWDRFPVMNSESAIVGLGWNNKELMLGYEVLASWNYHYLTYLDETDGSTSNVRARLVENDFENAEHSFPMNEGSGWAQSGRGTISLYAAGEFNNLKGSFKYGTSTLQVGFPSVSLPYGLSFQFEEVDVTYTPDSGVVTSARPTQTTWG